jgi:hypothetical protein
VLDFSDHLMVHRPTRDMPVGHISYPVGDRSWLNMLPLPRVPQVDTSEDAARGWLLAGGAPGVEVVRQSDTQGCGVASQLAADVIHSLWTSLPYNQGPISHMAVDAGPEIDQLFLRIAQVSTCSGTGGRGGGGAAGSPCTAHAPPQPPPLSLDCARALGRLTA